MGFIVIGCFILVIYLYLNNEKKDNKKIKEENQIIEDLIEEYKKYTKKELKGKLKEFQNEYKKLESTARTMYKKNNNDDYMDYTYMIDKSIAYQKEIDFPLYAKVTAINNVLENEEFIEDFDVSNYKIIGKLKTKNKEGKNVKFNYIASVRFDQDNGERIAFVYDSDLKKKKPGIGKMGVIRYDYIKKVSAEEDGIIIYLKNMSEFKKIIMETICCDVKVEEKEMFFKLQCENSKELKKEILNNMKYFKK